MHVTDLFRTCNFSLLNEDRLTNSQLSDSESTLQVKIEIPALKRTIDGILRPIIFAQASQGDSDRSKGSITDEEVPDLPLTVVRDISNGQVIGVCTLLISDEAKTAESRGPEPSEGTLQQSLVAKAGQTCEFSINLLPQWRGRGVGGEVLDVVIEGWAKMMGISRILAVI